MKMSKEQLEKIIFGVTAGIIFVVVLFSFVLGPSFRRSSELRTKIAVTKDKLTEAKLEIEGLAKLKQNLKKQEDKIKQYQQDMPEPTPDWLLGKINSLALETGINFDKMEHRGHISQLGRYWLQGLYLELSADYHTLGKFINKLENASPFLKVLDLSIMADKNNPVKHNVKLTVGAYVAEEK